MWTWGGEFGVLWLGIETDYGNMMNRHRRLASASALATRVKATVISRLSGLQDTPLESSAIEAVKSITPG